MKRVLVLSFILVFGLTGCGTKDVVTPVDSDDPCDISATSEACIATYDERTVYEYTDMEVSREQIYSFDDDLGGFEVVNGEYLTAGSVKLSGSGVNTEKTSYMYNRMSVPKEITFGLVIRYTASANGSEVRIVAFNRFNEEIVLQEWKAVTNEVTISEFDLSSYNGQTLALYIEQRSNQETENSIIVDDIRFGISGNISLETSWTFDADLDDWSAENNGKAYDHAEWKNGFVYLDGSDFGLPEVPAERNGWIFNMFQLAEDKTITFSFDVWANGGGADANFRIRVFDEDVNEYVLNTTGDWETFDSDVAYRYSVDLTQFAGQRIAIFLESDDDGEGSGEGIFIDNINLDIE